MSLVLTRATKEAARYTAGGGRERCSQCRFFYPQGTCGRIVGPVSPRGWCRYFSQELVYNIYQPGGSAGVGGGSSLDLTFTDGSGVLDPRITFTRASTATYFDSGGVMRTAAINAPRFDYAPATRALRGLLIEEARTNNTPNSGRLDNASWTSANLTVTATASGAPDGTTNAIKATPVVAVGPHIINPVANLAITAGSTNTFSIFAKAAGYPRVYLQVTNGAQTNGANATFNLTTGIASAVGYIGLGSGGSAQMTNVGNGWYRCALSVLLDGTSGAFTAITFVDNGTTNNFGGDGTSGVYLWGGQVEAGAFPTSYIPTTSAAVTRAIEVCQTPTAPWFVTTYSLSMEFDLPVSLSTVGGICDVTFGNATYFNDKGFVRVSANTAVGSPLTVGGAVNKQCGSFAPSVAIQCCNNGGGVATVATAGTAQTTATRLAIGNDPWSLTTAFNGHMRRVQYWPRVLSDAEMQSVTT